MGDLRLIFNGDDYGRTGSINAAIIEAHERGVLTSASLMVTAEAAQDAARRAREHPKLAVGLHVAVMGARGALLASQVPHLVDGQGQLPNNVFLAGVRYFLNPILRRELRCEIAAQFERFLDLGLPLAHVDGHYLLHLHPAVFSILIPLAEQYGAPGMRLPRDDLSLTLALDRSRMAGKAAGAAVYALLCLLAERRLRRSSVAVTDRVYGFLQTGRMREDFVVGLLRHIPPSVRSAEIYFHPNIVDSGEPFGANPGDLAALVSPRVREALSERGAELTNYAGLQTTVPKRRASPSYSSLVR